MRDVEKRGQLWIKERERRMEDIVIPSTKMKMILYEVMKKLSIEDYIKAIENFKKILEIYPKFKKNSKYKLEYWTYEKFLENIGWFLDYEKAIIKIFNESVLVDLNKKKRKIKINLINPLD